MRRSSPGAGLRQVLGQSDYRRLWAACTASQCGDVVQFTALALLVLELTGSAVGVSGIVLAEVLAVLVLAPIAGPVVDRWPRVGVMVASDLVRVALAGFLAVWHTKIAVVYGIAFPLSAGAVFFNPASNSLLPALVDDDHLVAANSGIWTAAVLPQILLAPLVGLLVTAGGFTAAFAINAVSFAVSALMLRRLRPPRAARPAGQRGIVREAGHAFGALGRDRLLRAMAVAQALAALSAGATSALLVVLTQEKLRTSDTRVRRDARSDRGRLRRRPAAPRPARPTRPPPGDPVQRLRHSRAGRPGARRD